ncbi:uncharacterized protein [Diadema antillarum]
MSKRQSKEALSTHIKRPCVQVPRPIQVYAHEPAHGCSHRHSEAEHAENSAQQICSSSCSSSSSSTSVVDVPQQSPDQLVGSHNMDRPAQSSPPCTSPLHTSPLRVSPPLVSPPRVSPPCVSPSHASPSSVSTSHASPTHASPTHISPSRTSPPCSSPSQLTNCEACHCHRQHHQQLAQPQLQSHHHHHNHSANYGAAYSPPPSVDASNPKCDSHHLEPLVPKVVPKSSGGVLPIRSHASLPSWIKSEDNRPMWAKRPQPVRDMAGAEAKARTERHAEAERNKPELEAANPVTRWPNAPKWVELEQVCKAITSGHDRACKLLNHRSPSLDAALGSMKKGTPDFQMTKEDILVRLSSLLGSQYERIVHFAQSIPGFGDISKEDQRILLQIGGLEVILLQISQVYDNKSKLLRMWEGMWLSPDQARKLSK